MGSESSERHHRAAEAETEAPLGIAVVTVSDSRTEESDSNGQWLRAAIEKAGHTVAGYRLIRDAPEHTPARPVLRR